MKKVILSLVLPVFFSLNLSAQKSFTGIAKYKMTVDGSPDARADTMAVIFGKDKIKVILYLPSTGPWSPPAEKPFIDNFTAQTSMAIEPDSGTYTVSPLKATENNAYVNTHSFAANRNFLCLIYKADTSTLNRSAIISAECLGSIDFNYEPVKNYSFLGVQPIVVDNRIVMEYVVKQANGLKPRVTLYDIKKMDDTESYFNVEGLKEVK